MSLPSVAALMRVFKVSARHQLSQNFLFDKQITGKKYLSSQSIVQEKLLLIICLFLMFLLK
jgi:hypothetical protein